MTLIINYEFSASATVSAESGIVLFEVSYGGSSGGGNLLCSCSGCSKLQTVKLHQFFSDEALLQFSVTVKVIRCKHLPTASFMVGMECFLRFEISFNRSREVK